MSYDEADLQEASVWVGAGSALCFFVNLNVNLSLKKPVFIWLVLFEPV